MFQHPVNFQDIPMTDTKRAFSLLPTVITLAWPTMLENIMATAVQYIDTAMVGTLGTRATAAVGSTMTINWLLGGSLSDFGEWLSEESKPEIKADRPDLSSGI